MRNLNGIVFAALLAGAPLASTGCGARQAWAMTQAQSGGVTVIPIDASAHGGKLWVRTNVINGTSAPIVVVRDGVRCVLPDGSVIGRASGKTSLHQPYVIEPGGAHPVYVEFEGDFRAVPSVNVDFSQAITSSGQAIGAPQVFARNLEPE
jgi:hypothetical protein